MAIALLLILALPGGLAAATKKKSKKSKPPARPHYSAPAATGDSFQERISSLVNHSLAERSVASLEVIDVETGTIVASHNRDVPVAPASNLKLFTTAAAMDILGPDFEYVTTVSYRGDLEPNGTLHGDVKVTGRGDPTIGGRFHDRNSVAVFEDWAKELKRQGVRTIEGDLVFEYGYFDTQFVHPTWPENQLMNWYEAPVAALSLQEGCVAVRVTPGRPGARANVRLDPPSNYFTIQNTSVTRGRPNLMVSRLKGSNTIIVAGDVPPNAGETEVFVTIVDPVSYFATVMRETLERNGVSVKGQTRLLTKDPRTDWKAVTEYRTPLPVALMVTNKKSQNHYAEQILKTIGAEVRGTGSWQAGSQAVMEWLHTKVGVANGELLMTDGSGMSRDNRASAEAFVTLLRYVWKRPYVHDFISSMPYTGEEDSRLRHRLNKPPYSRQVYAKTGYIVGVAGLTGYVHAQSGKVYAFSFLFNDYNSGVWEIYRLQDEILKEIVTGG